MPSNMHVTSKAAFARFYNNELRVDFTKLATVFNDFSGFKEQIEGLKREMADAVKQTRQSPERLDQQSVVLSRHEGELQQLKRRFEIHLMAFQNHLDELDLVIKELREMPRQKPGLFSRITKWVWTNA